MSKSTPAAPTPPDPAVTAQAQGAANIETARAQAQMNRVNQYTPNGNLVYTPAGENWVNDQLAQQRAAFVPQPTNDPDRAGEWGTAQTAGQMTTFDENAARKLLQEQNPYRDQWSATTTLSDSGQRQLDLTNQAAETYGRAANSQLSAAEQALSRPFDPTLPDVGTLQYRPDFTGIGDPNQARDQVESALMGRLNPSLTQNRLGAENRLRNQGLTPGSEAWNSAIRDVNQSENDARLGVIANAGQEQSRMFDLGLRQAGLNNSATAQSYGQRGQSLQEQLALRNQPINEASALLSGQMLQTPSFTNVPQVGVGNTDYLGAVGQQQAGQQNAYNAQIQTANANRSGMYGLGAAAITAAVAI